MSINDPSSGVTTVLIPFLNKSAITLQHGHVVVKDPVSMAAATPPNVPEAVTTTTTQDSPLLAGVVYDPTKKGIPVGEVGQLMVRGFHDGVKVNGTADIAVGDLLSTYSAAGISGKVSTAAVGGVLGVALAAYTNNDSNGVIKAFIDLK